MIRDLNKLLEELKSGIKKYSFLAISETHKANPKINIYVFPSFSFYIQVLSILLNPLKKNNPSINLDIKSRAKYYLGQIGNNIGSLSSATSYGFIRNNAAKFINQQSGMKMIKEDVKLTKSPSSGLNSIFNLIINDRNDGNTAPYQISY